ncbi:metallophosphoesterase [Euzebya sp.]|uniref:metallophosphoesterase family protein n=1 Tax=Euzebya sp. TaxID=1971409 RepID=UPI00351673D7
MPELQVAVIADTHRTAARAEDLPPEVYALCKSADVILHAGDITDRAVLDVLGRYAAVHAVLGNNDRGLEEELPERLELDLAGVAVAMVHDSGPAKGREARLHRMFPTAGVVVFGHSHIPWDTVGVDGQILFNPGSPTQRRRQPVATCGRLVLADGAVVRREIIPIHSA